MASSPPVLGFEFALVVGPVTDALAERERPWTWRGLFIAHGQVVRQTNDDEQTGGALVDGMVDSLIARIWRKTPIHGCPYDGCDPG